MADSSSNSSGSSFTTSVLGVAAALILFAALVWILAGFGGGQEAEATATGEQPPTAADLREQDNVTLETYGWVDQENEVVRIPVERATELVLEELNQ